MLYYDYALGKIVNWLIGKIDLYKYKWGKYRLDINCKIYKL